MVEFKFPPLSEYFPATILIVQVPSDWGVKFALNVDCVPCRLDIVPLIISKSPISKSTTGSVKLNLKNKGELFVNSPSLTSSDTIVIDGKVPSYVKTNSFDWLLPFPTSS